MFYATLLGNLNKKKYGLSPHGPKTQPPPQKKKMWTMFFYCTKYGIYMNGLLSKSFKKMGTLDFAGNPLPIVDLVQFNSNLYFNDAIINLIIRSLHYG